MSVQYGPNASSEKECLKRDHPRGPELVAAFERDLSSGKLIGWAALVAKPNRYAIVYTPPISPDIEIRVSFLLDNNECKH